LNETQSVREPAKESSRTRKFILRLIPWTISGALILFVIATSDMSEVSNAFRNINIAVYFGFTVPLLCIVLILESIFLYYGFKWFAGVGLFFDLVRARAAAYLLGLISVFIGMGGLVLYGKRRYNMSYSVGTNIMLNELYHELASTCTLAMMVGLLLPESLVPLGAINQVRTITIIGIGGVGFYILGILVSRLFRRQYHRIKVLSGFADLSLSHYVAFYAIKVTQNVVYGIFLYGILASFGISAPMVATIALMQIIQLTRGLPVTAFGIGVDQITIPTLFGAWATGSPGILLAASIVFTFTLMCGRALLGIPFVNGVFRDMVERTEAN